MGPRRGYIVTTPGWIGSFLGYLATKQLPLGNNGEPTACQRHAREKPASSIQTKDHHASSERRIAICMGRAEIRMPLSIGRRSSRRLAVCLKEH